MKGFYKMGSAGQQSSSSSSSSENWSQSISESLANSLSNSFSQGTSSGSSQNQSSSSGSSESKTMESALSQEQLQIAQNREKQYNEWFFPEMQQAIDEANVNSSAGKAKLAAEANNINASYNSAQNVTRQNLAKQGLLGDSSGVEAALKAQNERAKSSALSAAYYNQLANSNNQKTTLLNTMAGLMTTPTNSAQYHTVSQSQNNASSFGSSQNSSQNTSQSNSQSTASSTSKSESQGTSSSKSKGSGWNAGIS